jgi:hypothetical protein
MRSAILALALLAIAKPVSAGITLGTGAGTVQPDQNLLFNNNPPNGITIQGVTNSTNTLVDITGNETLLGNGGQARVESVDGNGYQKATFKFNNPFLAMTSFEFNLNPRGNGTFNVTIRAWTFSGNVLTTLASSLGNGSNFFYGIATGGDLIARFEVETAGANQIEDIRQIRLGGIQDSRSPVVPEPMSAISALVGLSLVAAARFRFKKKA